MSAKDVAQRPRVYFRTVSMDFLSIGSHAATVILLISADETFSSDIYSAQCRNKKLCLEMVLELLNLFWRCSRWRKGDYEFRLMP